MEDLMEEMPSRRFMGESSIWRVNGTGTRDFYVFWLRVYRSHFTHSTTFLD